ncbi:MAG: amidohydrolase family protein [Lentisphaeria bacterium]|nr:amidohydrolase family protein [Lentisphaeria bacterium]
MFIDIHVHAYRGGPPQDGRTVFCTPEQVLRRYDELGIERGCVQPLIGPEVYLPQSNEDVLAMCAASNGRLIPFCNIDPRGISNSPDAPLDRWLGYYRERGCRGVGEVMPNLPFQHPLVQNLFRHVEAVGLPLCFDTAHALGGTYGLYDDPGLPQLELSLRRFPKLVFLGHGPEFWAEIGVLRTPADRVGYPSYPVHEQGVVPTLFRRYPNLYGDLSAGSGANALLRDPEHAVVFLNEFQDRLLFGTDLCTSAQPLPLAGFLSGLRDAGRISEGTFRAIARENARRVLALGECVAQ